ncbi:MAG: bifunctional phosphopantothenoylcysteine decarboxylase/phosphopantothenate--cysteine ligase CoaBC [Thermomicrobiales bacterium]
MTTSQTLQGKRIVLGVSGGIAAYKAADLTSKLVQAGAIVDVVLTDGALAFIRPLTFNALTRRQVHTTLNEPWSLEQAGHVSIAADADLLIVAPATANTIARLALGLVDDMLTAVALATQAPILIAPAMEHHMWHHAATQHSLAILRERGVTVVDPETGRLASGAIGDGRLAVVERIVEQARTVFGEGPLMGRRVVVTAGGTQEAIDPVRYIGNRSSGRMGVELAIASRRLGASVTLIAVEDVDIPNMDVTIVRVRSALDMQDAVETAVASADVLIMAAAVAVFRPATEAQQKIKKQPGQTEMTIELVRNPDIVAGIGKPGLVKVGFAAETEHLLEYAESKLRAKGLAMIVANDAVGTIGSSDSEATLLFADRGPIHLPKLPKRDVAMAIVSLLTSLLDRDHA